jgi:transcriptional regulator with XRE-family HTH domain
LLIDAKSFGEKVRALRMQRGLTLADLAQKTQRSISLLSQIENDNISPSFSSMQTIADALEVPLAQIISQEPSAEERDSYHIKESERKVLMTQGEVQHQLLSRGLPLSFEFNVVEVPPGASTGDYLYSHEGEECGLLLEGELVVESGRQVHHLKPGDSITMKSSLPHKLSNPGKQKARAVWVNSVPYIFSTK